MKLVKGGSYIPLYGVDTVLVKVPSFFMDVYPVTNQDYVQFVKDNPKWKKSKVIQLFAEENYLRHWQNDEEIGVENLPVEPVVNISWFAANAYCECQGKRLPSIDEWEYVAMANEKMADARKLKSYNEFILAWYEKPKPKNNPIGSTFKNYWGIYDLHGLVWEWTSDFNSVLVSGESRKDVDTDTNLFCGSAAIGATDLMNYAAFMRYAIRGSLKANYVMKNLGFRCVKTADTIKNK
nr:formylglycine-generating enzyme family protein [Flavicella sediminum]